MTASAEENSSNNDVSQHMSKVVAHSTHQFEDVGTIQDIMADEVLEHLSYAPELVRTRSTFQVASMSFVLASVPYGLATNIYCPSVNGGPATIIWASFMVSIVILCVAPSLGEINPVYPTAGGVNYQTFMLAPVRWRRLTAWICGWAYVSGNIIIALAVNFGTTLFFVACVNMFESAPGLVVFEAETYQIFLVFVAITVLCAMISGLGNPFFLGWT